MFWFFCYFMWRAFAICCHILGWHNFLFYSHSVKVPCRMGQPHGLWWWCFLSFLWWSFLVPITPPGLLCFYHMSRMQDWCRPSSCCIGSRNRSLREGIVIVVLPIIGQHFLSFLWREQNWVIISSKCLGFLCLLPWEHAGDLCNWYLDVRFLSLSLFLTR